jgi:hypothetical protein
MCDLCYATVLLAISHTCLLCVACCISAECYKILEFLAVANLSDMGNELRPIVLEVTAYQYLFNTDC